MYICDFDETPMRVQIKWKSTLFEPIFGFKNRNIDNWDFIGEFSPTVIHLSD